MNIRQAILKAANHIESNPERFDYGSCGIPEHETCGTPGCAVGWVAFFAGQKECNEPMNAICARTLGIDFWNTFIRRMDTLDDQSWRFTASQCAKHLRLYADKYHPATPDWNAVADPRNVPVHELVSA